jgi:hypothetical protein
MEKGGDSRPLFLLRARSAYRFLPAFFFPPLAFFAIVFYPPLHLGFTRWIVSGCRLARSRDCNRALLLVGHKEWLQQAILIPDVDYGCGSCYVKHKVLTKVKKFRSSARTRATIFSVRA